uniref:Uncharacterized protein LOC111123822 isoform X3 n=1 Tax=Crassostrea virginica TaxID=6565 RepID=A0A8B8D5N2_CRAVI|nr:uncharacterized protein LOC111123822 isoform X3 [Crassostrea virginica]
MDGHFLLALLVGLPVIFVHAVDPPDNIGKEYILMFMENFKLEKNRSFPLEIYISTPEKTIGHVTIDSPVSTNPRVHQTITVQPGAVQRVNISEAFRMVGSSVSSKGLLVQSDQDITVYGANKDTLSNDVYCAIPVDVLGTEYYAACFSPALIKTELGVAATQDTTSVTITLPNKDSTLTVDFQGKTYKAGESIHVKLDKYQTLQLQSSADLTGAHIVGDKPVAAFSGNIKTNIGIGKFADHLVEQLTPVDTWGKKFVTAPIPKRTTGDFFRFIASEDNTEVQITGMAPIKIPKAGDWVQVSIPSGEHKLITSSKPVMLTQYVMSQQNDSEPADPSMMIIPPYELFGAKYTFSTPQYSRPDYGAGYEYQHEFMVIVKDTDRQTLLLDDKPFPSNAHWTPIPGTDLVGGYVTVSAGSHSVRNTDPTALIGGYLYGHAFHESYGFPTGMRLAKINAPCNRTTPIPGDGIDNDCDGKIDEELCTAANNQKDDDNDGEKDEDCALPLPVDGEWSDWQNWGQCSVSCENGTMVRQRQCDNPAPAYGGHNCSGADQETKACDSGKPCPVDIDSACKKNKTAIVANPFNCAQYYDCSKKTSMFGKPYLQECKYPDLFSPITNSCQPFSSVTGKCGRRKEVQAPCEYVQNVCNATKQDCVPCTKRLPSCVGLPDGKQIFPGKQLAPDYIECQQNRTIAVKKCHLQYFNPQFKDCKNYSRPVLNFLCSKNQSATVPDPENCAKFYDCSKIQSSKTLKDMTTECKYPDLFSSISGKCQNFKTVNCSTRKEPMAPCEYTQNLCPANASTCIHCPKRLPSCVGLPGTQEGFPGKLWLADYIVCDTNRTMNISQCPSGEYFNPRLKKCMKKVPNVDVLDYCSAHPKALLPKEDNCGQYFNCSDSGFDGNHTMECKYPDLFSVKTMSCQWFENVTCDTRMEPQAPCEYQQNLCAPSNTSCIPCKKRLPSCVSLPDGKNPIEWLLWKPDYAKCYKNRTLQMEKCSTRFFDPVQRKCTDKANPGNVDEICKQNPKAILRKMDNCAQYFNCSVRNSQYGGHLQECSYPDLFSTVSMKCEDFKTVTCDNRTEPQAPCEYVQNLCPANSSSCVSCPKRLPSCVGLPGTKEGFPGKLWQADYIVCDTNRTMNISQCPSGEYFNPRLKKCMKKVPNVDVLDYCSAHPKALLPKEDNCGQYFNCSDSGFDGNHTMECKYPDLFSVKTMSCQWFENVTCDTRMEPQAPCEYQQNLCAPSNTSCIPCKKRLPSCVSLPDGKNPIEWLLWKPDYAQCYKNRTLQMEKCSTRFFDPVQRKCTDKANPGNVDEICKQNPKAILRKMDNCAQYFNCSVRNSQYGGHLQECSYPDLFSTVSMKCEDFKTVTCDNRTEPQAPCEYVQNLCPANSPSCVSCPKRLPSCVGLPGTQEGFPGKLWLADYIVCDTNRTMNISQCPSGEYFNPRLKKCMKKVPNVDVLDYCSAHPKAFLPKEDNCGQYFNCSDSGFDGNHTMECKYPDLFSVKTMSCQWFENVTCDTRMEPQAPCEYQQNLCAPSNTSCIPCKKRLPSCVSLPDGKNPIEWLLWKPDYAQCYKNRTLQMEKCSTRFFDPVQRKCTDKANPGNVDEICKQNPKAILRKMDNCAQYFNCSVRNSQYGGHLQECSYPDLFSTVSMKCEDFKTVTCDNRTEPQAPCEYVQNLCPANSPSCVSCPKRLPSCVGLPGTQEGFPGKLWQADYIVCDTNRTMNISQCPSGEYFNPRLKKCMKKVPNVDVLDYCSAHPKALLPKEDNCGQYFNCSDSGFDGNHTMECKYPDLFSVKTMSCQWFENVTCDTRMEPQAPCEYQQNLCAPSNTSCIPCKKRLPSCVSLPDGKNPIEWLLWKPDYAQCYKNRTLQMEKCSTRFFDPVQRKCTDKANPGNVDEICKQNPKAILRKMDNCAQYFNCSVRNSQYGGHLQECSYPDLFSTVSMKCEDFKTVTCDNRTEPQAPCEYVQNLCPANSPSCVSCPKRLPSCVGLPGTQEGFPGKLWLADYIVCDTNRTMNISQCPSGEYFNPRLKKCMKKVPNVDVLDYCSAHPKALLPKEDNCGQYFNCSDSGFDGNHTMECKYPDLFSVKTMSCQWFENVTCDTRMEPQAPCEYQQNLCAPSNTSCIPCKKRLPSCVSLPDGKNPIEWLLWKPDYAQCYKNRTLQMEKCSTRFFDPVQRKCTDKANPGNVDEICKQNPKAILRKMDNCAQYFNCSVRNSQYGGHLQECSYPDLFSTVSMKCEDFKTVTCDNRTEPQAPCEYVQNLCPANSPSCVSCPKRLPSCVGLPGTQEGFPGKLWQADYIVCDTNRTMNISQCPSGEYFNPRLKKCMKKVPNVDVLDYCSAHPKALLPKEDNCGQYFNCSDSGFDGNHTMECKYPDLFSVKTMSCQWFENVTCDTRMEPQAPCEYQQNLCAPSNTSCIPCKKRLPSCVSLPDGKNPIEWLLWKPDYAQCYKNRTLQMEKCSTRFFDPVQRKCTDKANPGNVDEICKQNPKAILRKMDNCAQYFNCSVRNSQYGGHLQECSYPDLFSTVSMKCEDFKTVTCDNRTEPQAPCEYVQNLCPANSPSCVSCPKRLPSCVGLPGTQEGFPGKLWQADYIVCDTNRTMNISQCPSGEYFNPRLKKCMKKVPNVDVLDYCSAHPKALLPKEDNCGQYFNCSDSGFDGNHTMECKYPDLFSVKTMSCQWFENVTCDTRMEPQAPCEYQQNLCAPSNTSCIPCKKRLPSCVSLPDGKNPIEWLLWKPDYAQCYKNRTLQMEKCSTRFFDPVQRKCTDKANPGNVDEICKQNPKAILRKMDNCAQYFNCSVRNSQYGGHLQECSYPDLFSTVSMKCEDFKTVTCDNRTEPQAPCEYVQNLCPANSPSCVSCPKRLPSCVGLPGTQEGFPGKLWQADYIVCDTNRTMNISQCPSGEYFNPRLKKCMKKVPNVDVLDYCSEHPKALLPKEDNCGQYFNCSDSGFDGNHTMECKYPDLFSVNTMSCQWFENATCDTRMEPQAPCEYLQNICQTSNQNCQQCPERLPSCVGKPDGPNMFPLRVFKPDYIVCYHNRTVGIEKCSKGYFHPVTRLCTEIVDPVDVPEYCAANPTDVLPDPDNCAHFFDCNKKTTMVHRAAHVVSLKTFTKECPYPDLFDYNSRQCMTFTSVDCRTRPEPMIPCEYQQNLCVDTNPSCAKCETKFPSCKGLTDGPHFFPGKEWERDYIFCFKNRTTQTKKCPPTQYFNPRLNKCTDVVETVDVPQYCTAHRKKILPDPDNCAKFFNCSDITHSECSYPDLFSYVTSKCERFLSTSCDQRPEPQAPCEYDQNKCPNTSTNCLECNKRLPSCKGLQDGIQPVANEHWGDRYITCLQNRTLSVTKCPRPSVFDPILLQCRETIPTNNIDEFCKVKPNTIRKHPTNCAQYYNCSRTSTRGDHLFECPYPQLFDSNVMSCQNFTSVHCANRQEPMAPCDYIQNRCLMSDKSCVPCPSRLPSCIGLPDGQNPVVGFLWKSKYVVCYKNRTMGTGECPEGKYFHPRQRLCLHPVKPVDVPDYCKANPNKIISDPYNCAQYFNCSLGMSNLLMAKKAISLELFRTECAYPSLFEIGSSQCKHFEDVVCKSRPEPQAPCQYKQNICNATDTNCQLCSNRLPTCVGQSDGEHAFPSKLWHRDFIICYKNRTVSIAECEDGLYFNPRTEKCQKSVDIVDVPSYCVVHKSAILPDLQNCAKYFNCSDYGGSHVECRYPDLYSTKEKRCVNFTLVSCESRPEPQAPCEYQQNLCQKGAPFCQPCPVRLPSCIGLQDGPNPHPSQLWNAQFIMCYKNRTVQIDKCADGEYFHPRERTCKKDVKTVDVPDYCSPHPRAVLPDSDNCARFFNCSDPDKHKECTYPDLFSEETLSCQTFTKVKCDGQKEPQAPCEYEQNLCPLSSANCELCPLRFPSCVGKSDGNHSFIGRRWEPIYITCYQNRTIKIGKCPHGYFHPVNNVCQSKIGHDAATDYCKMNPTAVVANEDNCAKYYNCSVPLKNNRAQECPYPYLFSRTTSKCETFTSVACDSRPEPQNPCEYDQNKCSPSQPSCKPCPDRLPSCVGLTNGYQPVTGFRWTDKYMECQMNRTIQVTKCSPGLVFNPFTRTCVVYIEKNYVSKYCRYHPTSIVADPSNCAMYVNCSSETTRFGDHTLECLYPKLYDIPSASCKNFDEVQCNGRKLPLEPCDYQQNICLEGDTFCKPCPERFPSCIGLPNGINPNPNSPWSSEYIRCFHNRTVAVEKCSSGYFNSRTRQCEIVVHPVDVPEYCKTHMDAVLPSSTNCAKYYDCKRHGNIPLECPYPSLFSQTTHKCEDFSNVYCGSRQEPVAPCQYDINKCPDGDIKCVPCPERLPSCEGLPDGYNIFPSKERTRWFIKCSLNRTIEVQQCPPNTIFDVNKLICSSTVVGNEWEQFCKINPTAIQPHPVNCAQYYNCSAIKAGSALQECRYPNLFSSKTLRCDDFQTVTCGARHEPQTPCEYKANLCLPSDLNCKPCPIRLPSCLGLDDGQHPHPSHLWSGDFIICYRNRTISVSMCQRGFFNPRTRRCTVYVDPVDVNSYCQAHPTAVVAQPGNCAQFFNCSRRNSPYGNYLNECPYPMLYSTEKKRCSNFTSVSCRSRPEPQEPCEYRQNLCTAKDKNCTPCPSRFPSCVGLPSGLNSVAGAQWSAKYVLCYRNRTIEVASCRKGVFNPVKRICDDHILIADRYCQANPGSIVAHSANCAQYYNCSQKNTRLGGYLMECPYPQLFSMITTSCQNFTTTDCQNRFEPQAPCEYIMNNRPSLVVSRSNVPCPEKLPSCIGLSDGRHEFPNRRWRPDYIVCYQNRTVEIATCPGGYYHPYQRVCVKWIPLNYMKEFCAINPQAVIPHPYNCANYLDCKQLLSSNMLQVQECTYPQLFSARTKQCQPFYTVECSGKHEPMAPCEYKQNICKSNSTSCTPCPERLPTCVGFSNGLQPHPSNLWTTLYIICDRNRTIHIERCQEGQIFHPDLKQCVNPSAIGQINVVCKANPTLLIADPSNCARYYRCSDMQGNIVPFSECHYPDLYSLRNEICQDFRSVQCGSRPEPQAPCEYHQNLCSASNSSCQPCSERLPSCVGLSNGQNPMPGRAWSSNFVDCLDNRTLTVNNCKNGWFHPVQRKCVSQIYPGDVLSFCSANKKAIAADSLNAAHFINCSNSNSNLSKYIQECTYPQLFSVETNSCQDFRTVPVDSRIVPQAPCEYNQFHCINGDQSCKPCSEVHHSCVGLPDGDNAVSGLTWTSYYITCLLNRTIGEHKCQKGVFDPNKRICTSLTAIDKIDKYCTEHPSAIMKHPGDCGWYYNCSSKDSSLGKYIQECRYPQLFSTVSKHCEKFTDVNCVSRHEPQAPCEYVKNRCQLHDKDCIPCQIRLPSCVGLPDGLNFVPGKRWSPQYLRCFLNRTIDILDCKDGYFHPYLRICVDKISPTYMSEFCKTNPAAVVGSSDNCAQYIDCAREGIILECRYPDLFSSRNQRCMTFTEVDCGETTEPMAPCSYQQNLCHISDPNCLPCPERLPSCVGLTDGYHGLRDQWSSDYFNCYKNRTIDVLTCKGFFDPNTKQCVEKILPEHIGEFCKYHPTVRLPSWLNCAEYYDCSIKDSIYRPYLHECPYPQLFSSASLQCEDFAQVSCAARPEPMAPCQYLQNQCPAGDDGCLPCPTRLPSCLTLPDGANPFPNPDKSSGYFICDQNRTIAIKTCSVGYFDTASRQCVQLSTTLPQPGICANGRRGLIPDPDNCAKYFNCSMGLLNPPSQECKYPSLFSMLRRDCVNFEYVECGVRYEPQAPCEYDQNLCPDNDHGCSPCLSRLPSCVGKSDGEQAFPGRLWTPWFIECYKNRTIQVGNCGRGIFDPNLGDCVAELDKNNIDRYCRFHPSAQAPYSLNCAQYFDCRNKDTKLGDFLHECTYPQLFNKNSMQCADPDSVICNGRYKPVSPCDYEYNKCSSTDCIPCEQRFTLCKDKPDGPNALPGEEVTGRYVECSQGVALGIMICPDEKIYNPQERKCKLSNKDTLYAICKTHPNIVRPNPYDCAQFIDCSKSRPGHVIGEYIKECPYPKLFSTDTLECQEYNKVMCNIRREPRAPCEYLQNLCTGKSTHCTPCTERLPSCIGLPNGMNPIMESLWKKDYIECKDNRTLAVKVCTNGVFDPYKRECMKDDVSSYCMIHPSGSLPNPKNCAQFYDCSVKESEYGLYLKECQHPLLYEIETGTCQHYSKVNCGSRYEPVEPCEYIQSQCIGAGCPTCSQVSCRTHPDGANEYPGREHTPWYVVCEHGRTVAVEQCHVGIFDQQSRMCLTDTASVNGFCERQPGLVFPSFTNCAQFYECGRYNNKTGTYLHECAYPFLYDIDSKTCQYFTNVKCGERNVPQAPCDYMQNRCQDKTLTSCLPCQERFTTCVGKPLGRNQVPGDMYSYVDCLLNRTINKIRCQHGLFFHPVVKQCIPLKFFGHVPLAFGDDICNQQLVSGVNPVPDSAFSASSAYHKGSTTKDYNVARARINTTETKDSKGVLHLGAWSAQNLNVDQWIQVNLSEPSLIRGIMTQGRNGCCHQWVKKYRVLYSLDCGSNASSWHPIGDHTVNDTIFLGNTDENSIVTNNFDCPVIAKCVRINPLEWNNHISMRFDLLGCTLDTGNSTQVSTTAAPNTTSSSNTSVTNSNVTTAATPLASNSVATTSSSSNTTSSNSAATTVGSNSSSPANTTLAVTTQSATSGATTVSNNSKTGAGNCVKDCKGKASGEYQSCKTCGGYVTCVWGILYERQCPAGLEWNDSLKVCDWPNAAGCAMAG